MKGLVSAVLLATLGVGLSSVVMAQPNTEWTTVNLAVTDAHVIPSYNAFAASAADLKTEAVGFCAAVTPAALAALQQRFHAALDAWQGVQHVQFGPITYFNWNFRVQFWPDDNASGARQLTALLAAQDPGVLEAKAFARQSVGVQGFQALESLLFADTALADLQGDGYRCQVLQAIATNIDEIATGAATHWADKYRDAIALADDSDEFESAQDATIDFLKALIEPVRAVQKQKLQAVLGETPDAARPRRAESWRAARSLRNLKLNVAALQQLWSASEPALSSVFLEADIELIDAAFADLQAALAAQPDGMEVALAAEGGHGALLEVVARLDTLFETLEAALKNTDLYLGFNSLDGD
jgi:uncharacterized protein